MKKLVFLLFVCTCLLSYSCSENNSKENDRKKIQEMELSTLQDASVISYEKADSLIHYYESYVAKYPEDSLCATYLYRAADIFANTKRCLESIKMYDILITEYPQDEHVELAYFLKGVVYSQTCLNKEKAAESFELFISKYPNSKRVQEARTLLIMDTMKDEMDLIRQFEQINQ
jgi:outer membrane protein assembly factor BamD (BamD/ComL family)